MQSQHFFSSFEWQEFACGFGAALVNIGISYPIYKLIFRQMLHGVRFQSAFEQLRHEGMYFLYRGMLPPLAHKAMSLSVMFGVYEGTRRFFIENFYVNTYVAKILSGVTAGTMECVLLPFERIQTLLAHSKFHHHFENTPQAFRYVYVHHGCKEFYKGLAPVLYRNGPANALFFIIREEANKHLPKTNSAAKQTAKEFFTGAITGASISTLFYPLNVIKVAMQSDMGKKSESTWATCRRIYCERGRRISYFYRGCSFNSCRSFMSWGIITAAYENLKKLF